MIGHALGGVVDSGLDLSSWPIRQLCLAIYTFHMPLFFVLAGIFVRSRIARGDGRFAHDLLSNMAYPYILWSVVQIGLISGAGSLTNAGNVDAPDTLLSCLWHPVSQFWFLQTLLFAHALTLVSSKIGGYRLPIACGLAGLVLARSMTLALPAPLMFLSLFYPYYLVGMILGQDRFDGLIKALARSKAAIPIVLLAVVAIALVTWRILATMGAPTVLSSGTGLGASEIAHLGWSDHAVPAAICGIVAVMAVAGRLRGTSRAIFMRLGRESFPIYILHVMFVAGTRIVLVRILHVESLGVVLPTIICAGLAGPMLVFGMAKRWGINRVVGLP